VILDSALRVLVWALMLACSAHQAHAQDAAFHLRPFSSLRFHVAATDAQAAFQFGDELPELGSKVWRFGILGELETRVFGKDQLVPVSPTLRLQFQETRFQLGLGGYSLLHLGQSHALRFGAGMGYTFGHYRGVKVAPLSQMATSYEVGYSLNFATPVILTLGYQYRDWPHTSPHRFGLSFTRYWK
jgi:hypothetical protein